MTLRHKLSQAMRHSNGAEQMNNYSHLLPNANISIHSAIFAYVSLSRETQYTETSQIDTNNFRETFFPANDDDVSQLFYNMATKYSLKTFFYQPPQCWHGYCLTIGQVTDMRPCDKNLLEAIQLAEKLLELSERGDSEREDTGCGILFGVIRDNAYKIRKLAEKEIARHQFSELSQQRNTKTADNGAN